MLICCLICSLISTIYESVDINLDFEEERIEEQSNSTIFSCMRTVRNLDFFYYSMPRGRTYIRARTELFTSR